LKPQRRQHRSRRNPPSVVSPAAIPGPHQAHEQGWENKSSTTWPPPRQLGHSSNPLETIKRSVGGGEGFGPSAAWIASRSAGSNRAAVPRRTGPGGVGSWRHPSRSISFLAELACNAKCHRSQFRVQQRIRPNDVALGGVAVPASRKSGLAEMKKTSACRLNDLARLTSRRRSLHGRRRNRHAGSDHRFSLGSDEGGLKPDRCTQMRGGDRRHLG